MQHPALTFLKDDDRGSRRFAVHCCPMFASLAQSLHELSAADARRAALSYVSEAFAEALLDGIDVDSFADAALCAAFRELVVAYGEENAARLAERLPERVRHGEFLSQPDPIGLHFPRWRHSDIAVIAWTCERDVPILHRLKVSARSRVAPGDKER